MAVSETDLCRVRGDRETSYRREGAMVSYNSRQIAPLQPIQNGEALFVNEENMLDPYYKRIVFIGSHQIHQAKQVVFEVFDDLGTDAGWRFLGENWDWFEDTDHLADLVSRAWRGPRVDSRARRHFMCKAEQASFRKLPLLVPVFRGGCGPDVERGISWSLKKNVAEAFVENSVNIRRAWFGAGKGQPRVVAGLVRRSQLLGLKIYRNEAEVVVNPGSVKVLA